MGLFYAVSGADHELKEVRADEPKNSEKNRISCSRLTDRTRFTATAKVGGATAVKFRTAASSESRFLASMGAGEAKIEPSFCADIRTAKEQKSISLQKRAEATFAEYRRQKANGSHGRGFRPPLC